jgi:hypothetical protein
MEANNSASAAEQLTQQFYDWELRGRGWIVYPARVELEPPFRPFEGHVLPQNFFQDDGREASLFSSMADRLLGFLGSSHYVALPTSVAEDVEPSYTEQVEEIAEIQFSLPRDSQPSPEVFEQCVSSLAYCRAPISFEIVGTSETLVVQVACSVADSTTIFSQLKSHFPDAVLTPVQGYLAGKFEDGDQCRIHEFGLEREFMLPLKPRRDLAIDPMVTLCGALEQLQEGENAVVQVIFQPVRNRWTENAWSAITTSDGDPFFEGEKEMVSLAKKKLSSPLFAVVIRVGVVAPNRNRQWEIIKGVAGAIRLFDAPTANRLTLLENDGYDDEDHLFDLVNRSSHRAGMLLSSDEVIAIAHLPTAAVESRKLAREIKRTKKVPVELTQTGVWLGKNKHEGKEQIVRLPGASRVEHMHVLGTQGTGKSTLLLNLICQDIYAGRGFAVLDPHGDLIDDILAYIPPERQRDVIIVDPADEEYPIGFNILSAHTTIEKNLLASDLAAVFRRLSTSWGDQMSSVLGNAVLAFVENTRVGTLPELRRFFVEAAFRKEILQTVTDPDIAYYWEKEFPLLKTNSLGPLLTRLDMFLRPKTIRYMVGQRENKIDFAGIMNEGKILLARLSQGIIGEENGFLLGTLLVSKFHQIAISRQAMDAADRRPFFLYIDEFHHFVSPSMASILTGVRKYRLGLILAHQNLTQLKDADVANSVLSSPYARVSFRVGDQDAKRVAESLSFFEPSDLLNLGRGEAICRIQKNDWDFNLETIAPPKPTPEEAKHRRDTLQYLTRRQYGTPREKIEEELAKSRVSSERERVDPFSKRTAAKKPHAEEQKERAGNPVDGSPEKDRLKEKSGVEELRRYEQFFAKPEGQKANGAVERKDSKVEQPIHTPVAPLPATITKVVITPELGRGGEQHKLIQEKVKGVAEKLGYLVTTELPVLNRSGSIDLALQHVSGNIAVEVTVTTTIDHEVGNVNKCLKAGYQSVVVLSPSEAKLAQMKAAVDAAFSSDLARSVSYFLPDAFCSHLQSMAKSREGSAGAEPSGRTRRGYKVTRTAPKLTPSETKAKEASALKTITEAMRRKTSI